MHTTLPRQAQEKRLCNKCARPTILLGAWSGAAHACTHSKMGQAWWPVPITPAFAASDSLFADSLCVGGKSVPGLTTPCHSSRQERRFREAGGWRDRSAHRRQHARHACNPCLHAARAGRSSSAPVRLPRSALLRKHHSRNTPHRGPERNTVHQQAHRASLSAPGRCDAERPEMRRARDTAEVLLRSSGNDKICFYDRPVARNT